MARPTKYTGETGERITTALAAACTRKASAEAAGVSYDTFLQWTKDLPDFAEAVEVAEAQAARRMSAVIDEAANGWDSTSKTRTVKTVIRTKKTTLPDGTIIEEPVAIEEVTEAVTTETLRDWRAALEFLKRRFRSEWGDKISMEASTKDGEPFVVKILRGVSAEDL